MKHYHPPHIYLNETIYFITAKTFFKTKFFNTDSKKKLLARILNEMAIKFKIAVYGWVILSDHYHLLIGTKNKEALIKFIKNFHGKSAFLLNKFNNLNKLRSPKIWDNYWDRCIRNEKDFYTRLNYIHHNPIKHGYEKRMESYNFSSYHHYIKKYGQAWLNDCFGRYPIVDFTPEEGLD